jgi:arylsulfatase A-like enzyme
MKNLKAGIAFLFVFLASQIGSASRAPAPVATPRRGVLSGWNIVLITLDATDPARIGAYGGERSTMPFFDKLAQDGLLVMNAYTPTGSTSPAHATMLSGLTPDRHGVRYNGLKLSDDAFWYPEALQKLGYLTVGSTVAFFLHDLNGFGRGFDRFVAPQGGDVVTRPWSSNGAAYRQFEETCLPMLSADKPFFAFIHLKGGHAPLVPIDEKFLRIHSKTLPPDRIAPAPNAESALLTGEDEEAVRARLHAYYDASLSEADETLRVIFQQFRTRGLMRKTLFIITGDHGESFDHRFNGEHWPSPWQSTLRVPLLLYTENGTLPPGRIADRLVMHADLVPTLNYLFGFPIANANAADAYNIFAVTPRMSVQAQSVSVYEYEHYVKEMLAATDKTVAEARRKDLDDLERTGVFYWARIEKQPDGIMKLLDFGSSPRDLLAGAPLRLFNVSADSAEANNLLRSAVKKRVVAAAMLDRGRQSDFLFGRFLSNFKGFEAPPRDVLARQLSAETIEKLKSLGYLQ